MTTAMLIAGGLFVGGTYSFARQKHYVGAVAEGVVDGLPEGQGGVLNGVMRVDV